MKFTVKQKDIDKIISKITDTNICNSSGAICMGYYDVMIEKTPIDAQSLLHKIIEYYMAVKYTNDSFGDSGELSPKQKKLVQMGFCDPLKMIDIIRANGNTAMLYIPPEASNRIKGIRRLYTSAAIGTRISNGTITIPQNEHGIMIYGMEGEKNRNPFYIFFFYDESENLCCVNPWDGQSIAMCMKDGHPPDIISFRGDENGSQLILQYLGAGIIIS